MNPAHTLATLILLLLAGGCSSSGTMEEGGNSSDRTEVRFNVTVRAGADYYLDGPQQARPADGSFQEPTVVRVVQDAGSYTLVESEDHLRVWVASSDLSGLTLH